MKLDVLHALRDPGTAYAFAVEQTIAPQDVSGEEVTFDPVQLAGHLTANEDGSVVVEGSLTTTAHAHCAKCNWICSKKKLKKLLAVAKICQSCTCPN